MNRNRKRYKIDGIVQGVGFRYFILRTAIRYNISGKTANMPDGSVIVEAEGEVENLLIFEKALRTGPPGAYVKNITEEKLSIVNETGFQVVSYSDMEL